jgi:hypothetical protein
VPDGPIACLHASDCTLIADACNDGACVNNLCVKLAANDGATCDDGLYCTENDICTKGVCGGMPKMCPGADACNVGQCDEAAQMCTTMPGNDGAPCAPMNDMCFSQGACSGGVCLGTIPVDCSFDMDQCNMATCNPMLGCQKTPLPDGVACNDGLPPTLCAAGVCTAGVCTQKAINEGGSCNDGLFCTINDHCVMGTCMGGGANPCTSGNPCLVGTCDEVNKKCTSMPGNDGASCTDSDVCNTNKHCLMGACAGGTPANNGMACPPPSTCTVGTTCMNGVCGGGTGPTVYFSDDFHDNSKGWTMDTEWQIGPAMTSSCQNYNNPDPAMDHSPSSDNGVAGIVVGGCESPIVHGYYYLTSPAFDTSTATGSVIFGYYRWLNSDYDPFMHNGVDVWDGTTWVNLWTSGSAPGISDNAWTYVSFDVTAHKNAGMKVRFGYNIGSAGVFTVSSWNVDDVLVASAACP